MADDRIKIAAFMSIPRYGTLLARGLIEEALAAFSIPLRTATGVFWGQHMDRLASLALDEGLDWLLFIDYDSCFTKHHLDKLFGTFGQNAHIDALAALQRRRGGDHPLLTLANKRKRRQKLTGEPLEVATAHFGLTLLRADALVEVPRPWWWSLPNAYGTWDEETDFTGMKPIPWIVALRDQMGMGHIPHHLKVDDDIWFWYNWRRAGKNIYTDTGTAIGHLEEVISGYAHDGPEMLYPKDWREKYNPPPEVPVHHVLPRLLDAKAPLTIVELGANWMQDTAKLHAMFPAATIHAVEPDPRTVKWLRDNGKVNGWKLHECAIASADGEATLHLSNADFRPPEFNAYANSGEWTESSTIKEPTRHRRLFPWVKFDNSATVKARALDSLCAENGIDKIDLLWMDVQGAEADVIAGGQAALRRTRYLFTECQTDGKEVLFAGQPTLAKIQKSLPGKWSLIRRFKYDALLRNEEFKP